MRATKVCSFRLLCFVFNLAHAQPRANVAVAETSGRWFAVVAPTRYSRRSFLHSVTATTIASLSHRAMGGITKISGGRVGGTTKVVDRWAVQQTPRLQSCGQIDSAKKASTTDIGMAVVTLLSDEKAQRLKSDHLRPDYLLFQRDHLVQLLRQRT